MNFKINVELNNTDIQNLNQTLFYIDNNINNIISKNQKIRIWGNSFAICDVIINNFLIHIHFTKKRRVISNFNIAIYNKK
jgi:hypothetical protein